MCTADFRGHVHSTHSREGQYNVPSFVADIESFIIELDFQRTIRLLWLVLA